MSIKSAAQLSVDDALKGLNFVDAIIALTKDPKHVENLKTTLIAANSISEERRVEAQRAAAVVDMAKEAMIRLEKEHQQHTEKVNSDKAEIEEVRKELKNVHDTLEVDKKKFHEEMTKVHKDFSRREEDINANLQRADARHKAADARDRIQDDREKALDMRENKLEADVKAHKVRAAELTVKRKKLAAAAKEAEQEE